MSNLLNHFPGKAGMTTWLLLALNAIGTVNAQHTPVTEEGLQSVRIIERARFSFPFSRSVYEVDLSSEPYRLHEVRKRYEGFNKESVEEMGLMTIEDPVFVGEVARDRLLGLISAVNQIRFDTNENGPSGFSSDELQEQGLIMAHEYSGFHDLDGPAQECLIQGLSDPAVVAELLPECFERWWNTDMPAFDLQFCYAKDTIRISSEAHKAQMGFWNIDPKRIEHLLTVSWHVKTVLLRTYRRLDPATHAKNIRTVEDHLTRDVYEKHCKTDHVVRKYERFLHKEIDLIYEHFDINQVNRWGCYSVNWGFEDGSNWNAEFHPKGEPKNLRFDVTLPRSDDGPGSVKAVIEQKDSLLARIKGIPFVAKALPLPKHWVEIDFVTNQSVGRRVRESFLEDAPEDITREFEPMLDEAIFLIMPFFEGNAVCHSRWLLFPDGRNVAWQFSGDTPFSSRLMAELGLPKRLIAKQCTVFDGNGKLLK